MPELTPQQEAQWRRVIKKGLMVLSESEKKQNKEEERLKMLLKRYVTEVKGTTDVADTVIHPNTGINVLDDLLKNIIKTIEKYYKNQSTDEDQRKSFRYHYLVNFKNALQPINVNRKASETLAELRKEKIELKVGDNIDDDDINSPADQSKFIPARPQDEKEARDAKEEAEKEEKFLKVDTSDPSVSQGANFAEKAWNDTENQIINSYEDLVNPDDADKFYDYGLTNLKLYFDKFEAELERGGGEEPSSPDYEPSAETQLAGDELPPEPESGVEEV